VTRVVYYVYGVSRCSILVSFFVSNPRITCACTFDARRRKGQVGSHRYNRVRRERISGGSLTFPFVGSHDALGNRVIRFRPYIDWLYHRSLVFSTSCPRGLRCCCCTTFRRFRATKPVALFFVIVTLGIR